MIKTKKNSFLYALAIAGVLAVGCGSGSGTDDKTAANTGAGGKSGPTTGGADAGCKPEAGPVKIGFIVKSMADSWFQTETSFAKEEAATLKADINVQEAKDGPAVMSTIDTMATNGVQGIIICSPETKLGPAIKRAADNHKIKLMSVDDQLIGQDGKPMADIPHLGISATNIGKQVGEAISGEMKKRGWKPEEVGALALTMPSLETAMQRVKGAESVLSTNGFKADNMYEAVWSANGVGDAVTASDAANVVITQHSGVKKWVVFSSNDDGVIGGVRALTNRGIPPTDIIGVGINGPLAAREWEKGQPTGVFASVLLQPKVHGANTVEMMGKWITACNKPAMETYTSGTVIDKTNYKDTMKANGVPIK